MRKKRERPVRNLIAKDLHTPKYKQRVVRDRKTYTRKVKHKPDGRG